MRVEVGRRHPILTDCPVRAMSLPTFSTLSRWTLALYAAVWLPVLVLFFATQRLGGVDTERAAVVAVGNVLPAAVLGLGAFAVAWLVPWPRRWTLVPAFAAAHATLAAVYGFLWTGAAITLTQLLTSGTLRVGPPEFDGWWWWGVVLGALLYYSVVSSAYAFQGGLAAADRGRALRASEAALAQAEAARTAAELAALRAHLDPHFFFNTLHALSALVREDPRQAQQAIEWFGDLFRYTLRNDREGRTLVPLSEELDVARTYLDLEGLRLGPRLRVSWDVDDDALDALVPPLLVQPLVENAVRHGIAPRRAGGALSVGVWVAEGDDGADVLQIEVADDGDGAALAAAADAPGYGIRGLRRTLAHLYGPAAALTVRTQPGAGFVARVHLPLALQAAGVPALPLPAALAPA